MRLSALKKMRLSEMPIVLLEAPSDLTNYVIFNVKCN